ncbi:MAG: sensor histidine kinase [Taibaiella sp.]|nr:sensor histidine kinase [Taibaiella sp.]
MYKLLTLLMLIATCLPAHAQQQAKDSLKTFYELDSLLEATLENDPGMATRMVDRQDNIANLLNSDTLRLLVTYHRADIMGVLGFRDIATQEYYKVLRLAEKLKYRKYEAQAHYNIGNSLEYLEDYKAARTHFHTAYNIAVAANVFSDTTGFNFAIGSNMAFSGNKVGGLALLRSNIDGAKKSGNFNKVVVGLDQCSYINYQFQDHKAAVNNLVEALPYLAKINSNYRSAIIYQHLCESYMVTEKWDSASLYLTKAFKYATLINSPDWLYECYKDESWILAHKGDYKAALAAHRQYGKYKDTVYSKDYNNKVAALSSKYQLEKKQSQIALLQKDNALRTIKIKETKLERNVVLLGSSLLLVSTIAVFNMRMNRKTKKLQKMFSRDLVVNLENDKQRIAGELHDSIGQNLLFIKNQIVANIDNASNESLLEAITATIEEVRTVSKDLYPNQLEKYGLGAAVNSLADKTMDASGVFVSASLESIEPVLTKEAKINSYRIIQESITNVVKHAGAKAIRITGAIQRNRILLTILDNGKGFDPSALAQKAQSSFGLVGIEERARILDGKMQLDTSAAGTKITISFPINHYDA